VNKDDRWQHHQMMDAMNARDLDLIEFGQAWWRYWIDDNGDRRVERIDPRRIILTLETKP
jgi:hypothetical protein